MAAIRASCRALESSEWQPCSIQGTLHGSTWRRLSQRSRGLLRHPSLGCKRNNPAPCQAEADRTTVLLVQAGWKRHQHLVRRSHNRERHPTGPESQRVLGPRNRDPEDSDSRVVLHEPSRSMLGHGESNLFRLEAAELSSLHSRSERGKPTSSQGQKPPVPLLTLTRFPRSRPASPRRHWHSYMRPSQQQILHPQHLPQLRVRAWFRRKRSSLDGRRARD